MKNRKAKRKPFRSPGKWKTATVVPNGGKLTESETLAKSLAAYLAVTTNTLTSIWGKAMGLTLNVEQPRVPAGSSHGGEFTSGKNITKTKDTPKSYDSEFNVGKGGTYHFHASWSSFDPENWHAHFTDSSGEVSMTGERGTGAVAVMRHAAAALEQFVKDKSPEKFTFSADKADKSRVSLYDKFAEKFAARHGYHLEVHGHPAKVEYQFHRSSSAVHNSELEPFDSWWDSLSPTLNRLYVRDKIGRFAHTGGTGGHVETTASTLKPGDTFKLTGAKYKTGISSQEYELSHTSPGPGPNIISLHTKDGGKLNVFHNTIVHLPAGGVSDKHVPDPEKVQIIDHLKGASKPMLVEAPDGSKWVMKEWQGKAAAIKNEADADAAYRAAGVPVPDGGLAHSTAGGKVYKFTQYLEGAQTLKDWEKGKTKNEIQAMYDKIGHHMAADALFANWDVIGAHETNKTNIMIHHGEPIRIDNGGALKMSGLGKPKGAAFGPTVGELKSLRDPNINPSTAEIFKHVSDASLHNQIKELLTKKQAILDAVKDPETKAILSERMNHMEAMVNGKATAAATPTYSNPVPPPAPPSGLHDYQKKKIATMAQGEGFVHGIIDTATPNDKWQMMQHLGLTGTPSYKEWHEAAAKFSPPAPTPTLLPPVLGGLLSPQALAGSGPAATPAAPASMGRDLTTGDGLKQYIHDSGTKHGVKFTDLQKEKIGHLNPGGVTSGTIKVPQALGDAQVAHLQKILPPGTTVKKVNASAAKIGLKPAAGGTPTPAPAPKATPAPTPTAPAATTGQYGGFKHQETQNLHNVIDKNMKPGEKFTTKDAEKELGTLSEAMTAITELHAAGKIKMIKKGEFEVVGPTTYGNKTHVNLPQPAAPAPTYPAGTFGALKPGDKYTDLAGTLHTVQKVEHLPTGQAEITTDKTKYPVAVPHVSLQSYGYIHHGNPTAPPTVAPASTKPDPGPLPSTYAGLKPGHVYANSQGKVKEVETVQHGMGPAGDQSHITFKGESGTAVIPSDKAFPGSVPTPLQKNPVPGYTPPAKQMKVPSKTYTVPTSSKGIHPEYDKKMAEWANAHPPAHNPSNFKPHHLPEVKSNETTAFTTYKDKKLWDSKEHMAWVKSLTPAESSAINSWKGSPSYIKKGIYTQSLFDQSVAFMNGIAKEKPWAGVTYRGMHEKGDGYTTAVIKALQEAHASGGMWLDNAPHCMSVNVAAAHNGFSHGEVLFRIKTKTGRPIHKVGHSFTSTGAESEMEVVGMPNTKYKVVGYHTNVGIKDTAGTHMGYKTVQHFFDLEEVV